MIIYQTALCLVILLLNSIKFNRYTEFGLSAIVEINILHSMNTEYTKHDTVMMTDMPKKQYIPNINKYIPLHNIWSPNIPQISVSQIYAKSQNIWHLIVKYTKISDCPTYLPKQLDCKESKGDDRKKQPWKRKTSWVHYFVTFHLFHLRLEVNLPENMSTLNFANHDILCFLSGIIASVKAGFA